MSLKRLQVLDFGKALIKYDWGLQLQQQLFDGRRAGERDDTLLILQAGATDSRTRKPASS